MLDHCCDARAATGRETPAEVDQRAREILEGIADDKYSMSAGGGGPGEEVSRSADRPIEAFEVVTGEAL